MQIATSTDVTYRCPTGCDASGVQGIVRASPPLDVNSTYAYWLVCTHFAGTSIVAERDGILVGFVSAYLDPRRPDVVFVWQVAVAESARGLGVGRGMLHQLLARPSCEGARYLETTVGPSNAASRRLFRALARDCDAPIETVATVDKTTFGGDPHEDEQLLRIGPIAGRRQGGT